MYHANSFRPIMHSSFVLLLQELDCYLLDYNGYIVLSENPEEVLFSLQLCDLKNY